MAGRNDVRVLRERLMAKRKKAWSLAYELYMLGDAVEAARLLTDAAAVCQLATEHDNRRAVEGASAVLTLVTLRMRDIGRVLRGEMKAEALRGPHNEGEEDPEGHDVILD